MADREQHQQLAGAAAGGADADADADAGKGQHTMLRSDRDLEAATTESQPQTDLEKNIDNSTGDVDSGASTDSKVDRDPNVVAWDGPDDPENPLNWPESRKWLGLGLISAMTLVTPLGSSMFAPGIPGIMVEFGESSATVATFVVSVYVLGFAFGPLVVAPLSETYGRAPLYRWGNVLFVVFSVATALSRNMDMMMAFRFLMGLAGSVPLTIGSGSIADMMPIEKRGRAMAVWALGPLIGPCVGPVAGGYLIQAAGWEWVYWLVAILAGIFIPPSFFLMRETYHPVLLQRKTNRLRNETGNTELRSALASKETPAERWKNAILRPLKLLVFTPVITLMALYVAIVYGIMYLLLTTFSFVYAQQYGFDEGTVGLTFLPAGIGMMIGVVLFGGFTDFLVKRKQAQGAELKPEVRLTPALAMPCAVALPLGLFLYGWTTHYAVHWVVPMVGVVIFSCGLMGVMMCVQNYLLDAFPQYAASVTAALAVLRSLAGALLPLGGLEMYNDLGLGWGNSLLGFISAAMIPLPLLFFVFGERIRGRTKLRV
ncbi:polyamine transporter 3 [Sodiomyces alkalinus F11]|uniref:Polyamine transporter 3 n=1 Tax=Sodiomyces alkalinus (strain CBS 110278 / VKM F-3762 / F11) TaxID=1314773 RepID=A0A3N2PZK0_SODAK|nr:polyamine transporter 3 [Sodiomyces alkalinus F11]ROT39923.1 polyamine transporter 3 [Sodiomyces alkalinus F11]